MPAVAGRARRTDALATADAVLHEGDIDPGILALVRRGVFVEPVASVDRRAPGRSAACFAPASSLPGDGGWCGPARRCRAHAGRFAAAPAPSKICTDVCAHDASRSNLGRPQQLATAFNGLAG